MKRNPRKLNVTIRHIWNSVIEGDGSFRKYRGNRRLCFSNFIFWRPQVTYRGLADYIDSNINEDTIFFPDTNFFTAHEVAPEFWSALTRRRVVIAPMIWRELAPWRTNPHYNHDMARLVCRAERSNDTTVLLDHQTVWDEGHFWGRQFYVTLLSWRKQYGRCLVQEFIGRHGRAPDRDEMNRLFQASGLDKDFHLFRKGHLDFARDNYFADEDLVVTAAVVGLLAGCNTVILTRDRDVLEQFQKLMGLLTWQYQALLFADRYAASPRSFVTKSMPRGIPEVESYFHTEHSFLVRKPVENPDDFVDSILPVNSSPVLLTCLLFGGCGSDLTMTPLTFDAEQDMDRLVIVKGMTRGLSTDKLDGKNCHVVGFPKGIDDPRSWVIVSSDKIRQAGTLQVPNLEMEHALLNLEIYRTTGPRS